MSKKTLKILYILLAVLGIAAMAFCSYQIMVSYFLRMYLRLALYIGLGIAAMAVTGFALIRFKGIRKKHR